VNIDFRQLKPYRDYQLTRQLTVRLTALRVIVALGFVLYVGIFWFLQVVQGQEYRLQAEENRLRRIVERPVRGQIRDMNGTILATNRPSFAVYIDRERTDDPAGDIRQLARFLGEPADEMLDRLERARGAPRFLPVMLKPDVGIEIAARVSAHRPELPAIDVEMVPKRHYRFGAAAAHVLGYLSESSQQEVRERGLLPGDLVGQTGIERSYDESLRGERGVVLEEVNASGRPLKMVRRMTPTRHGRSLRFTLDGDIQQILHEAYDGRPGAAVFLDPWTGAIRALYSGPSFDPNLFSGRLSPEQWSALVGDPARPLQNRALRSVYSPGSTYKVVMAAAALEEGVLEADERVFCGGSKVFYGHVRHCHFRGGHGWVGLEEALTRSCNVFFYTIGQRLGIEKIADWSHRFGLGSPSGVPLAGEAAGLVPTDAWKRRSQGQPWYPGETISVAIGQGPLLVTPLQVAIVAATVANGGARVQPHLLEGWGEQRPPMPIDLHETTLSRLRAAMTAVVESDRGTARRARVEGIEVAGKTGTAQVVALDAEDDPGDHAWFMGFGPVANPQLAFAIIVEHGGHGGATAAPIAARVLEAWRERHPPAAPEGDLVARAGAASGSTGGGASP
jgi:penicillin-binding protein 2